MKTKVTLLITLLMAGQAAIAAPKPITEAERKKSAQIIDDAILIAARQSVKSLQLSGKGISDLSSLEDLTKLEHLELVNNKIIDLTPLAGLKSLKLLWLTQNPTIKDYSPIAGIRGQLEEYSSGHNGITNLEILGVAQMTSVKTLWLQSNQITDLTPLAGLEKLERLILTDNKISDLTPLLGLKQIRHIDLSRNDLTLAEIEKLKNALPKCSISHDALPPQLIAAQEKLREKNEEPGLRIRWTESTSALHIHNPKGRGESMGDLSPLRGLPIKHLSLGGGHGVKDLSPLVGMKLERFSMTDTRVVDLSPLEGMPLKELEINRYWDLYFPSSIVSDLSPLRGMKLKKLHLEKTKVTSIAALEGMPLEELWLTDSPISDLTPLRNIKTLKILKISGTKVTSLEVLSGLDLDRLYFSRTKVSDLKPLKNMRLMHVEGEETLVSSIAPLKGDRLLTINFQRSKLSTIEPIRNMPGLYSLWFADSKVRDLSPLVSCPKISGLSITDPKQASGLEAIRSLKSLSRISIKPMAGYVHNRMTPVDFWNLMADPDHKPNYFK